jgi:hypothetical protein
LSHGRKTAALSFVMPRRNRLWVLLVAAAGALAEQAPDLDSNGTAKESPWLLTPTVSSDPKLGTTLGGVAGYTFNLDAGSRPSTIMGFATYSDTESWFAGAFGDIHWGSGKHQATAGLLRGTIRNEYEDFLGTGLEAKTTDDVEALFLRYKQRVRGNWFVGGQAISSNYAIGADGLVGDILEQIGLVGFDSNGLGAVLEYDSRDSLRNPTRGQRFILHNFAYRERLGGDESFDTVTSDYTRYTPFPLATATCWPCSCTGAGLMTRPSAAILPYPCAAIPVATTSREITPTSISMRVSSCEADSGLRCLPESAACMATSPIAAAGTRCIPLSVSVSSTR